MANRRRKPANPGQKRAKYRATVESRLTGMGYSRTKYRWDTAPAALTVIIGDEFKSFALHAGQSVARTERELGKLEVWAEILRLTPSVPVPAVVVQPKPRARASKRPTDIVDLEELVAASHSKSNGAIHVTGG